MMIFLVIALSCAGIALGLYNTSRARKSDRRIVAHIRAMDVLTDPDLLDPPTDDDSPGARRRKMRLLSCTASAPSAIDWVRERARSHPASAASVVTIAAASCIALAWPHHAPDSPVAMQLPAPTVAITTTGAEPSPSTGPPAAAAPVPSVSDTPDAPTVSQSVSLTADVTAPVRFSGPSSATPEPTTTTLEASKAAKTPKTTSSTCAVDVETNVIRQCVIVR